MEQLFSTEDVHPRDRFDYWHSVACRNMIEHESRPKSRKGFEAKIKSGAIGDIGMFSFETSPMDVAVTASIAARQSDYLFVCRQAAGELALNQGGRELVLSAGDLTLIDPQLPYTGQFSTGSSLLVLKVPRRALEVRIGKVGEVAFHAVKPIKAESALTSSFIAMLPAYAGKMGPAAERNVKEQALDLVAMTLAAATEGLLPHISSARRLALVNVRAAIEARLTDPTLDAGLAATAAGISVRYANAILAEYDTSIAQLIRSRRLARCRAALEDPIQAHRSLSEIAYGWGFSDMTHFGRSFKQAYGMLPSEWRRRRTHPEAF